MWWLKAPSVSLGSRPLHKKHANKVRLQLKTLKVPNLTKDTVMVPTYINLGKYRRVECPSFSKARRLWN